MELVLNTNWEAAGAWPYVPQMNKSAELGNTMKFTTPWISASVPGSIHKDLLNAGLIADPYFDCNSLNCEWVSNRWWVYRTAFTAPEQQEKAVLIFHGIDYKAQVFLNRDKLGEHTGMYTKAVFDVTDKLCYGAENTLTVYIESAPEEMSQIGYTEKTHTQKSRFNYKWDFSTRLVNLGLYGPVTLRLTGQASLEEIHVRTCGADSQRATLDLSYTVDAKRPAETPVTLRVRYGEQVVAEETRGLSLVPGENRFAQAIPVPSPKLWYPNDYGEQPLYTLELDLPGNGPKTVSFGFRALSYAQNETAPEDSLPYTVAVNGKRIYLKGVNLVPLDHMYGSIPAEKYETLVRLMKAAHINLVRVWGGGLIESELFYHLCDQNGILVWQEFIQSSSGISNQPSIDPEFLALLKRTAEAAVKDKRNHVSLTFWSGGNELTDARGVPSTFANPNLSMLQTLVARLDPDRLMLPTSGSGPLLFLDPANRGNNHDVHGPWQYQGPEGHYALYNSSDSLLHSEFGVDGMGNFANMSRYLSPAHLRVTNTEEDFVWRHHGEWWDTFARDIELFGQMPDLETFCNCSQFIQAEGLRYALEANRRRVFQNSGSIIWQLNEPWPNVSCTSLVDYYCTPKLAYRYVKTAFSPIHVSLKYPKLAYLPGELFTGELFVHSDLESFTGTIGCTVSDHNGAVLLETTYPAAARKEKAIRCGVLSFPVPRGADWLQIALTLQTGGESYANTYHFLIRNAQGFCALPRV